MTDRSLGAIGVDLNADHLAVAETDASGNCLKAWRVPLVTYGRSTHQAGAIIGDAVASVVEHARSVGKPIVIKKLHSGQEYPDMPVCPARMSSLQRKRKPPSGNGFTKSSGGWSSGKAPTRPSRRTWSCWPKHVGNSPARWPVPATKPRQTKMTVPQCWLGLTTRSCPLRPLLRRGFHPPGSAALGPAGCGQRPQPGGGADYESLD